MFIAHIEGWVGRVLVQKMKSIDIVEDKNGTRKAVELKNFIFMKSSPWLKDAFLTPELSLLLQPLLLFVLLVMISTFLLFITLLVTMIVFVMPVSPVIILSVLSIDIQNHSLPQSSFLHHNHTIILSHVV
jgi:hypothetical protein